MYCMYMHNPPVVFTAVVAAFHDYDCACNAVISFLNYGFGDVIKSEHLKTFTVCMSLILIMIYIIAAKLHHC